MDWFRKINRTRTLLFLLLSNLLLVLGCASNSLSEPLSAEEQAWLAKKGEIVFVSQSVYPPFEFVDKDKSRTGMCLELVRWIATEFGIKARFRDMSFKEAQTAVLEEHADVITSFFYSEERDKKFDFTQMTWEVPALIFVNSERPDITRLKDLQGKTVAMQSGDYAAEYLKNNGIDYKLISTITFAEAVNKVVIGEADAVIGDKQIVLHHLFSNQLTQKIKSVGEPLYTGQNSMGVREGAKELQSILNKGIELAQSRGVFATLESKWFGTHYALAKPWYDKYLFYIVAVLVTLLGSICTVLFWNAQLRKTVQKKTENLRESEAYLQTLINNLPDLVWAKDKDGCFLSCNTKVERLFGATKSEILGKTDYDFVEKELADFFRANDKTAMNSGHPVLNEETVVYADDGHEELLETVKAPMVAEDGRLIGVLGVARDITERRKMETQLRQTRKLEAIGRLAGGVAHDLNNILSGIVSYPELLLLKLPQSSELRQPIQVMQESGKRASEIVADLLTVARGIAGTREISNLNNLVDQFHGSPEYAKIKDSNKGVTWGVTLDPDLLNLSCSPVHVMKCLMNLVTNASESMSGSGHIEIETYSRYLEQPIAGDNYIEKGEYVVLKVSDTGEGISSEDINYIFEPFYTKKEMGKSGTGLGLYIVWNTVQDHGGGILVDSNDGGTAIELYFPATREELAPQVDNIPIESLKGQGETILVVDDEHLQREIASQILDFLGYNVEVVSSGEEAIEQLIKKPVDLVLLDMLMAPGINGRETYERIIKNNPGQKVILVSGFSENDEVKAAVQLGAVGIVKKPYTMNMIGEAVKDCLGQWG